MAWAVTLLVSLTAGTVVRAGGVDVSGLAVWQGREVRSLELDDMPDGLSAFASKGLALAPRRKLLGSKRARLHLGKAEGDARRLRLLLARHGFPDAIITGRGEAAGEDGVKITFIIRPGPAVVYGRVIVQGLPPEAAGAVAAIDRALSSGRRFDEDAVRRAREDLLTAQQHAGHAHPEVDLAVTRPDSGVCDLVFTCVPGHSFLYRDLRVEGAPEDLITLVHRTVDLESDTPYSPEVSAGARRSLRKLKLFRQVRLRSEARDSTTLDLIADLKARNMITANVSVGSFTDNWLMVRGGVLDRNLLRGGRGLGVSASHAAHLREVEARTWWPALMSRRSRTDLRLRYEVQDEESYRLDTTELGLSTLLEAWRTSSLRLGIAISQGDLDRRSRDADAFTSDIGLQTILSGIWYRDTSDTPLDPHRGSRLTLQGDWSPPGFWTETPFGSLRAFGSWYFPLGERSTLAMRLDGAIARPLGEMVDLLPDRRWFAGGVSTMRGYGRRGLGPVDSEGNPVGGEARILAGGELRLPLWSLFRLALFVDSGQVWSRPGLANLVDLAVSGGAGLLVGTPIGPVRFDYAYNLTDPVNDRPRSMLQLGIGHPY